MATEAHIKINLDANKADKSVKTLAKSIDESKKSTMSARAELKKLTQDLMNMDPASKGFQTATQRAGQLRDEIKDTQAVINATAGAPIENLAKGLNGVAQIGIAGAQGLTSAYALFGGESEQVMQTLVKLQALAGLGDTLKAFGGIGDTFAEIKASFSAFGASLKDVGTETSNYVATAGDLAASTADIANSSRTATAVNIALKNSTLEVAAAEATKAAATTNVNNITADQIELQGMLIDEYILDVEATYDSTAAKIANAEATGITTTAMLDYIAVLKAEEIQLEIELGVLRQRQAAIASGTETEAANAAIQQIKADANILNAATTEINTGATISNSAALEANAFANATAADSIGFTVAQTGLATAATLGIVAVLALAAAGVYLWVKALNTETEQSKRNREEHEKYVETKKRQNALAKESAEYVGKEASEYVSLISALKNTNEGSKERATLMKQINTDYGTTLQNLSDEAAFQDQLNTSVKEYISLQYNRFKLEKNKEYFDQQLSKRFKAEQEYNKLFAKYEKDRFQAGESTTRYNSALNATEQITFKNAETLAEYRARIVDFDIELRKSETAMYDSDDALNQLGLRKEQLLKTEDNLTLGGKRYVKQNKESTKTVKDNITEIEKFEKRLAGLKAFQLGEVNPFDIGPAVDAYSDKITKAETDVNNRRLDIYGTYGHEKLALEENLRQAELALLDLQLQQELAMVGLNNDEKLKIESEYAIKRQEILRKSSLSIGVVDKEETAKRVKWEAMSQEERVNLVQSFVDKIAEIEAQATELIAQFQQNRQDNAQFALDSRYELEQQSLEGHLANQKISQEQYDAEINQLDQAKREDQKRLDREAFERSKKIQISNAIIQTAQAVLNAFASGVATPIIGPATGTIYAGIAAGFGAAQIAAIQAQPFTAARGGVVPGNGSGRVDTVNAMLAPGEAVINAQSTGTFLPILNAMNQLGGGKPLVATQNSQLSQPAGYSQPQNIRAYVVEREITDKQTQTSRTKRNAKLFR